MLLVGEGGKLLSATESSIAYQGFSHSDSHDYLGLPEL